MDASLDLQAIGFVGDVRKQDDAARVLDSTVKHFGRLDILVNAAAGNFLVAAEDLSPNGFKTGLFEHYHHKLVTRINQSAAATDDDNKY